MRDAAPVCDHVLLRGAVPAVPACLQTLYLVDKADDINNADYLWTRIEPLLDYLTDPFQRQQIRKALQVAQHAHRKQYRKSGEPFITHPVEVTRILAEMKLDYESLISGLLHDTVEDTEEISFDGIEEMFGSAVRRIVEGETKLSKITKCSAEPDDNKAKDLQGLFLAMTEDVRIIMVKLADRLHNMRTLYGMKPEKQLKIAQETLQVRRTASRSICQAQPDAAPHDCSSPSSACAAGTAT
jgi:GTP pyrophosphokinase